MMQSKPSKKGPPRGAVGVGADKRHQESAFEVLDQQAEEKRSEADDFVFVEEDEESVNDFHSNHTIVKETSMKQKIFKSM
jgi:hypothetical protein